MQAAAGESASFSSCLPAFCGNIKQWYTVRVSLQRCKLLSWFHSLEEPWAQGLAEPMPYSGCSLCLKTWTGLIDLTDLSTIDGCRAPMSP